MVEQEMSKRQKGTFYSVAFQLLKEQMIRSETGTLGNGGSISAKFRPISYDC